MCGRYSLDPGVPEIASLLAMIAEPVKTGEIFPTDMAPVLRLEADEVGPAAMAWGFPRWDGRGVIFNARAESALDKPMFRQALLASRVAVPTTGYYEWHDRVKYLFTEPGSPTLYLAGFCKYFDGIPCFTILTTQASEDTRPYHDRMPLLLHASERESWVRGDDMQSVLERMQFHVEARRAG